MLYAGVDVGGTFTDVIMYDDRDASLTVTKVSTTPKNLEDGILEALQNYGETAGEVDLISHATTVATNALLTHSGLAHTALITNSGFRDVLEIGRQRRAELYNLRGKRPVPLVPRKDRFTVRGRILSDGTELEPLSKTDMKKIAKMIARERFESVAVAFLNSYVNPKHERQAGRILKQAGYQGHVDLSSDVDREYREFERTSTTVVNACLAPLVSRYLANLSVRLKRDGFVAPVYVMNSDGSASTIHQVSKYPVLMIESGPAAGVLASRYLANSLSLEKIITFDMGGTTAKAGAVVNYEPDIAYEFEAAGQTHSGRSIRGSGYAVRAPFIDMAEVSAGGGTIAWVDEAGALKVGPLSAGSDPGPAAYGSHGKEPTVTDANIVLGRISPEGLLGGRMKLHKDLASAALRNKISDRLGMSVEAAAQGILSIVNNMMARAISIVSVERGRDPRDFSLVAFGGAGPVHACDLAEELGIGTIVIPPHAGLFSAYGLLTADIERNFSLPVLEDASKADLEEYFSKLRENAHQTLVQESFSHFDTVEQVDARYVGQSYEIPIPYEKGKSDPKTIQREFNERHKQLYGYSSSDAVEIVNAKLRAVIQTRKVALSPKAKMTGNGEKSNSVLGHKYSKNRTAWFSGRCYDAAPVLACELIKSGERGEGPCIIEEYDSTAVINPSWSWRMDEYANIILARKKGE